MPFARNPAEAHYLQYLQYLALAKQGKTPGGLGGYFGFTSYAKLALRELKKANDLGHRIPDLGAARAEFHQYGLGTKVNLRLAAQAAGVSEEAFALRCLEQVENKIERGEAFPSIENIRSGEADAIPELIWLASIAPTSDRIRQRVRACQCHLLERIGMSLYGKTFQYHLKHWAVSEFERIYNNAFNYANIHRSDNPILYWYGFYLKNRNQRAWFAESDAKKAKEIFLRSNDYRALRIHLAPFFTGLQEPDFTLQDAYNRLYTQSNRLRYTGFFVDDGLPEVGSYPSFSAWHVARINARVTEDITNLPDLKMLMEYHLPYDEVTTFRVMHAFLDKWTQRQINHVVAGTLSSSELSFYERLAAQIPRIFYQLQWGDLRTRMAQKFTYCRYQIIDKQCELAFNKLSNPATAKAAEATLSQFNSQALQTVGLRRSAIPHPARFWYARWLATRNKPGSFWRESDRVQAIRILEYLVLSQEGLYEEYQDPRPLLLLQELRFDGPSDEWLQALDPAVIAYSNLYRNERLRVPVRRPTRMSQIERPGKTSLLVAEEVTLADSDTFSGYCSSIMDNAIQIHIASAERLTDLKKNHLAFLVKCKKHFGADGATPDLNICNKAQALIESYNDKRGALAIIEYEHSGTVTDAAELASHLKNNMMSSEFKRQFQAYFNAKAEILLNAAIRGDKQALKRLQSLSTTGLISKEFEARFRIAESKRKKGLIERVVSVCLFRKDPLEQAKELLAQARIESGQDSPPTVYEEEVDSLSPSGYIAPVILRGTFRVPTRIASTLTAAEEQEIIRELDREDEENLRRAEEESLRTGAQELQVPSYAEVQEDTDLGQAMAASQMTRDEELAIQEEQELAAALEASNAPVAVPEPQPLQVPLAPPDEDDELLNQAAAASRITREAELAAQARQEEREIAAAIEASIAPEKDKRDETTVRQWLDSTTQEKRNQFYQAGFHAASLEQQIDWVELQQAEERRARQAESGRPSAVNQEEITEKYIEQGRRDRLLREAELAQKKQEQRFQALRKEKPECQAQFQAWFEKATPEQRARFQAIELARHMLEQKKAEELRIQHALEQARAELQERLRHSVPAVVDSTEAALPTAPPVVESIEAATSSAPAVIESTEAATSSAPPVAESIEAVISAPTVVESTEAVTSTVPAVVESTEAALPTVPAVVESTEAALPTVPAVVESTEAALPTVPAVVESTEAALPTAPTVAESIETVPSSVPAMAEGTTPSVAAPLQEPSIETAPAAASTPPARPKAAMHSFWALNKGHGKPKKVKKREAQPMLA